MHESSFPPFSETKFYSDAETLEQVPDAIIETSPLRKVVRSLSNLQQIQHQAHLVLHQQQQQQFEVIIQKQA